MNVLKKLFLSFCLCLLPFSSFGAGIPVIDSASIAQNAENFIKDLAEQASRLQELKNQLEQQIKQYESLTGIRNMAGLIDSVYNNDLDFSQDELINFLSTYGLSDSSENLEASELALEEQKQAVGYLEQVNKIQEETISRFNELSRLISEVNAVEDTKAVLDLQARITGEQAMLDNEAIKVTLLNQQAEAQRQVQEEQRRKAVVEFLTKPNTVKVNLLGN